MLKQEEVPDGWVMGRLPMTDEQKKLLSEHHSPKSVHNKPHTMESREKMSRTKRLKNR